MYDLNLITKYVSTQLNIHAIKWVGKGKKIELSRIIKKFKTVLNGKLFILLNIFLLLYSFD